MRLVYDLESRSRDFGFARDVASKTNSRDPHQDLQCYSPRYGQIQTEHRSANRPSMTIGVVTEGIDSRGA